MGYLLWKEDKKEQQWKKGGRKKEQNPSRAGGAEQCAQVEAETD